MISRRWITGQRWITVVEVCKAMKTVEPTDQLMWTVGALVRNRWLETEPELHYGLREKKNGGGSHQFAKYPPSWRGVIEEIILQHQIEQARQGDLFLWPRQRPDPSA